PPPSRCPAWPPPTPSDSGNGCQWSRSRCLTPLTGGGSVGWWAGKKKAAAPLGTPPREWLRARGLLRGRGRAGPLRRRLAGSSLLRRLLVGGLLLGLGDRRGRRPGVWVGLRRRP